MNATTSIRLYKLTMGYMKDRKKAKEFVSKIQQTIEEKFYGKNHD